MDQTIIDQFALHDYQQAVADFMLRTPRCGLFLPVGTGKTRIVLSVLTQIRPACHILIIAPAPIARISWKEEIQKTNTPLSYHSFVTGPKGGKTVPKKKRHKMYKEMLSSPPGLYTISRDLIGDLVQWHKDNKHPWSFPVLVIDELQGFKSPDSARFKAVRSIIKNTYRFTGLTGTPAPNGLIDLWGPIYLMDGGLRLGRSITRFRTAFFDEGLYMNGYCVEWIPKRDVPLLTKDKCPVRDEYGRTFYTGLDARQTIHGLIQDIVVSIDISRFLKLPERIDAVHAIELEDDQLKLYRQLIKEKVLDLPDGEVVTAETAAILTQKLTQMASGNLYVNEERDVVRIHDKKLDMLEYIVNNEPDPILIAYYFRTDLDAILERIPDAVHFAGEPAIKERWDKKQIHAMVIHPASVGFGLNMQYGGHTLVWYTLPWSLEHYIQTNGRIYRQGQAYTTVIHYLIAKNTIDEKIMKVLQKKDAEQNDLIDAVRMTIEETN